MCESYHLQSFMFLQVQQRLVFVHEKVRDLQLHLHLMWSRWFNVLVLLQYFICSLYRKNYDKKVTTYHLLPTYSKFFFASNTHTRTQTQADTHTNT